MLATTASAQEIDTSADRQRSLLGSTLHDARYGLVGIGLFSAAMNILALTGSIFMLEVYDRVLPSRSIPTLVALSLLATALFVFYGLLDTLRGRVLVRMGSLLDGTVSGRVHAAIMQLPLVKSRSSDGVQPLRDLDAVRSFLSGPAPSVLFDLPWVPLYLGVIWLFHPLLALVAFVGMLALVAVMLATEYMSRAPTELAAHHASTRHRLAETSWRNAEVLSAMGMAHRFGERWQRSNERYMLSQQRASDLGASFGALSRALRMVLQSGVLAFGAYLVVLQEATAGIIIAGSILTARALAPLDFAIPNWKGWISARQSWRRLAELLADAPREVSRLPLPAPSEQLSVERVSGAAPSGRAFIVQDVTFNLKKGDGLGIIGPSGSGKSSLARMLVGVWSTARGNIRLDGAALDQWSTEALGRHVGYLPQTIELLPGTIASNIARFDPQAPPESIVRAAKLAGVHNIIVNLPEGYQTTVGERGTVLSNGQQQRVALARALYGDPFLVVLDEPNSNLDAEGEAALSRAILNVRERGRIVIIIAHQPSALAAVDFLLVMGEGRMQALGAKMDILAKVLRPPTPPLKIVNNASEAGS
jgi:ATP-binding cassette subfamily C protein